jgi:hypothetical protein
VALLSAAQQEEIRTRSFGGATPTAISRRTGIPRSTVRGFLARDVVPASPQQIAEPVSGILDRSVRPLGVAMPTAVTVTAPRNGVLTSLLYGDSHFGHHDEDTLAIVGWIANEYQPQTISHMGDLLDCYIISKYDKNPARKDTLQDEIDQARRHLAWMRLQSPLSRFVVHEGNHEDRLRRLLWNLPSELRALSQLTDFKRTMTWPALLGLEEMGYEFVEYGKEETGTYIPGFRIRHGDIVRPEAAFTAKGEQLRWRVSGASGHTHRLGLYAHGSDLWVETGCTCRLEAEYSQFTNWQQGCVLVEQIVETGQINVTPVVIRNGRAVVNGRIFRA